MEWPIDDEWEDETPAAPADRQLVPEGHHDFKIERASEDDDKLQLVLAHPDKGYSWVWASFPRGQGWARKIVKTIPAALGLDAAGWASTAAGDLVGREIRARVYHKSGRDGRVFVNVGSFHPVEPHDGPPPAEPPPAAKVSRNAAPKPEGDDIPF